MVQTASTMLPLGTRAPDFSLPDVVSGKSVSLDDYSASKAVLFMFICRHCPFVIQIREELACLGNEYRAREVGVVAISANDAEVYPDDAPDRLAAMAKELGFEFPLCYDETQEVAKRYHAACTPDFFLFDEEKKLVYRGQLDDSRPGNGLPVTGRDLRAALDAVLAGQPVPTEQRASLGCNIKWKPGNAPK